MLDELSFAINKCVLLHIKHCYLAKASVYSLSLNYIKITKYGTLTILKCIVIKLQILHVG